MKAKAVQKNPHCWNTFNQLTHEYIWMLVCIFSRLLFWTEFGPPAQIERGNLDGTGRSVIKTGIDSPNGLAIDFKKDRYLKNVL